MAKVSVERELLVDIHKHLSDYRLAPSGVKICCCKGAGAGSCHYCKSSVIIEKIDAALAAEVKDERRTLDDGIWHCPKHGDVYGTCCALAMPPREPAAQQVPYPVGDWRPDATSTTACDDQLRGDGSVAASELTPDSYKIQPDMAQTGKLCHESAPAAAPADADKRDWKKQLARQYGSLQAARLRGDDKVVNAALQWLNIIAQEHWHEIIAALSADDTAPADRRKQIQYFSVYEKT